LLKWKWRKCLKGNHCFFFVVRIGESRRCECSIELRLKAKPDQLKIQAAPQGPGSPQTANLGHSTLPERDAVGIYDLFTEELKLS
jgi:hypothetical protein